jgi:hypothetical protein
VYLEHIDSRLFAEVIQLILGRQQCWVRPILLQNGSLDAFNEKSLQLYDLRQSADLIWPIALLHLAVDMEFLPLLSRLEQGNLSTLTANAAKAGLMQFATEIWQANPQVFKQG